MTKTLETPLRNVRTCSYSLNQQRRFKAQKHVRVTAKAACLYVQTGNGNAIYRSTVLDQAKKTISASSGENFCGFKSYCGCCVGCTVYGLGNFDHIFKSPKLIISATSYSYIQCCVLDPRWSKNCPKWPKMAQNDPKWPKMAKNGPLPLLKREMAMPFAAAQQY